MVHHFFDMKIVSWNVNGLRACLKRRKCTLTSLLDSFQSDIVCIQETKLPKSELATARELAVLDGWYVRLWVDNHVCIKDLAPVDHTELVSL